jgi:NADH-quinone oxidoreductase subunit F
METTLVDLALLEPVLEKYGGGGRTQLLPALLEAQQLYRHLPEPVAAAIGHALDVPLADVHGVISFYSMLYDEPTGRTMVRICTSPRCAQVGGKEALAELCNHLGVRPGETTPDGAYTVEEVPCLCLCDLAPAALVGDTPVAHIHPEAPAEWLEAPEVAGLGHLGGEPLRLLARTGRIPPAEVEAYEAHDGFAGLRRALSRTPEAVVEEITASGLVGRGGAAFPTGRKWAFTAAAPGTIRYVVCNGDESEPGTFKDRVLMEGDPLAVIEGMLIAGYAIGAEEGFIYIRGEYPRAQRIMGEALDNMRAAGYLGQNILGSDFSFEISIRSGAGAYICGEETALFESIEGKRGFPRLKPPYPTTHGLFGQPTVINNVETLAAATWIMAHGAEAYREMGTEKSAGTKLFCLSGDVARPGVYEVPFGNPLSDLLEMAGGVTGKLQGILLGGAAGRFATPDQVDLPMSFEGLAEAGLPLGSGVVMVMNEERSLPQTLLSLAEFFAHESCGKCYPCQLGTQRQLEIVEAASQGELTARDVDALQDVIFAMTTSSLCGLGMTAGIAVESALKLWPERINADKR